MSDVIDEQRFWAQVDIRSIPECWDWTGAKDVNGYGKAYLLGETAAHRVAYRLAWWFRADAMTGLFVLHSCDRPICVNPRHLRLGSALENSDDSHLAGWMSRAIAARRDGNPVPAWIHTPPALKGSEITIIRAKFKAGETVRNIAESHGLTLEFAASLEAS